MRKKVKIPNIGIAEVEDFTPSAELEKEILEAEKQAENDIEKQKQSENVNFRWSEFEIARAKKIAKKIGLPYQTYLKMVLKEALDRDEIKYF